MYHVLPEWVMFSNAPVAFLCTRMSFDFASLVSGPRAPDLAILALLSSCVARLVMQPTALHWTSTLGDIICRMRGGNPPSWTIATLFSATDSQSVQVERTGQQRTVDGQIAQCRTGCSLNFNVRILEEKQNGLESIAVDFSHICDLVRIIFHAQSFRSTHRAP